MVGINLLAIRWNLLHGILGRWLLRIKARLHARSISLHMLRSRYRLPGTDPHGWRVWVASPSPGRATGHSLVLWGEAEM